MNTNLIFLIVGDNIKYLDNPTIGHGEFYDNLGLDRNNYQNTCLGTVVDNKIVFYKSDYSYDDYVINCAKSFGLDVMKHINNYDLKVCCGVLLGSHGDWEPIYILNDIDIEGYKAKEKAKTRFEKGIENKKEEVKEEKKDNNTEIMGRDVLDFNNKFDDESFIKRAIIVTFIVLILNIIITLLWIKIYPIHNSRGTTFSLFVSTLLLLVSIFFLKTKNKNIKISSIIASILIVFNFNILSILLGIFYFIFIVDEMYINNIMKFINNFINKKK